MPFHAEGGTVFVAQRVSEPGQTNSGRDALLPGMGHQLHASQDATGWPSLCLGLLFWRPGFEWLQVPQRLASRPTSIHSCVSAATWCVGPSKPHWLGAVCSCASSLCVILCCVTVVGLSVIELILDIWVIFGSVMFRGHVFKLT